MINLLIRAAHLAAGPFTCVNAGKKVPGCEGQTTPLIDGMCQSCFDKYGKKK